MSAGEVLPVAKVPQRRYLGRGLLGIVVLMLGLLALAWVRGWFQTATEIPGSELTEGDSEVFAVVQDARAAVAREPRSAAAWGRLGQILQVHNFFPESIRAYAEASRLDPSSAEWPYLRATVILVGPRPADAVADLERAAERGGLDEIPRLRMAELFIGQGRFEEASEQLLRVFATRPDDPRAHFLMAQVAVSRQAWPDALRHLDALGDNAAVRKQVSSLKLLVYARLQDAAASKRERERLAQLPDDSRWPDRTLDELSNFAVGVRHRVTRALRMYQQGQTEAALSSFRDIVADHPNSAIAFAALGRGLAMNDEWEQAEQALVRSLELARESADVWSSLAIVRVRRGNTKGALESLREVIRLKPADARAHCQLGQLLAEAGDRPGATESFLQSLRYQPDMREAREGLDKLGAGSPKP